MDVIKSEKMGKGPSHYQEVRRNQSPHPCPLPPLPCTQGTSFTNIIWALANWRVAPDEKWLDRLMRCCTPLLPSFDTDQMAVLLQGLSDMQFQPSKVNACLH